MNRLRYAVALVFAGALLVSAGKLSMLAQTSSTSDPAIKFEVPAVVDPFTPMASRTSASIPSAGSLSAVQRGRERSAAPGSVQSTVATPSASLLPGRHRAITGLIDPPGGGDTDIAFDRSGKQYFADLYALLCVRTATTADGGATVFQSITGGCTNNGPGADRQWLAVYDPPPGTSKQSAYDGPTPLIYLEYNNLVGPGSNGGAQWNMSNAKVDPLPGGPGLTMWWMKSAEIPSQPGGKGLHQRHWPPSHRH